MMRWMHFLVMIAVLAGGCESGPEAAPRDAAVASGDERATAAQPAAPNQQINDGYFLLHELVSKQQRLSTALMVPFKKVSDPSRTLLRQIAQTSKEATDKLEAFAKADPSLKLDTPMLSPVETAARRTIETTASRRILGAGGDQFEVELLVRQADATDYGVALAKALAEVDSNTERVAWLKEFATQYQRYHEQAMGRLAVK